MWVLLGLLVGCVHTGVPMPGHPRFIGKREWPSSLSGMKDTSVPTSEVRPIEAKEKQETKAPLIAKTALQLKGRSALQDGEQTFRYDCSGFVLAAFAMSDVPLSGNTRSLFEQAQEHRTLHTGTPTVGELAFFDHTYDRNKNGKRDDELSHIAIVVDVQSDGTIQMVHLGGSGIVDLWMNLAYPSEHRSPTGKLWNSYLRVNRKGDNGPNLTGELFRTFGNLSTE